MTVSRNRARASAHIWPGLLGGALCGLVGALGFAAAHALLIVPVWDRLGSGSVWGVLVGMAFGWALIEHYPMYSEDSAGRAAVTGAGMGAVLWLLVAPVTIMDAALRAMGVPSRLEILLVVIALLLAVGMGAVAGWFHARTRRGAVAGAVATLLLTAAMGGPVPIANSAGALSIFLSLLPVCAMAGVALTLTARHADRYMSRHLGPTSSSS